MRRTILVCCALLLSVPAAPATDLEHGADALPYLTDHANIVVTIRSARSIDVPRECRFALFRVEPTRLLKGDWDIHRETIVAVARSLGRVPSTDQGAVVFLAGQVSGDEAKRWNIPTPVPHTFVTVSGRFGVLAAREGDARYRAITEFVHLRKDQRLNWAKANLQHSDTYVQRSAILELGNHPADREAISALNRVIVAERAYGPNRESAIQAVLHSAAPELGMRELMAVAQNTTAPVGLRLSAVNALGTFPEGEKQLEKWSKERDDFLGPAALECLRKYRPQKYSYRYVSIDVSTDAEVLKRGLESRRPEERLAAVQVAGQRKPSSALVEVLVHLLQDEKETDTSLKFAAISSLTLLGGKEGADGLRLIASNGKLAREVRAAAIRSLAKTDAKERRQDLHELAGALEDKELAALARQLRDRK